MGSSARPRTLPAVDDHLVREDARAEILRGKLVMSPPAEEPHGTRHLTLAYLLGAHVADGFVGAVDLLTRTGWDSDFAPDASVFPTERAEDGGRRLEVLAFEIASSQPLADVADKARALTERGVRRVFCVALRRARVLEWSTATDAWVLLAEDASIEDPCLARPLPIAALLDTASADDAVVRALASRGNRVIDELQRAARATALREAIEALADLDEPQRAALGEADLPALEALLRDLAARR